MTDPDDLYVPEWSGPASVGWAAAHAFDAFIPIVRAFRTTEDDPRPDLSDAAGWHASTHRMGVRLALELAADDIRRVAAGVGTVLRWPDDLNGDLNQDDEG